jgi:hypothetical protein
VLKAASLTLSRNRQRMGHLAAASGENHGKTWPCPAVPERAAADCSIGSRTAAPHGLPLATWCRCVSDGSRLCIGPPTRPSTRRQGRVAGAHAAFEDDVRDAQAWGAGGEGPDCFRCKQAVQFSCWTFRCSRIFLTDMHGTTHRCKEHTNSAIHRRGRLAWQPRRRKLVRATVSVVALRTIHPIL